jgi:hypothetical protein
MKCRLVAQIEDCLNAYGKVKNEENWSSLALMCCDVLDFWFLKTMNSLVVECVESLLCAFAREFWTRPLFLIDSLVGLTIHYRILTCWIDDTLPNPDLLD